MKLSHLLVTATVCTVGATAIFASSARAVSLTPVDLELSLLVDVSGSVNSTEFNLQRQGYVNAFKSSSIVDAISKGTLGSIAVNFIYWSGSNQQQEAVGWTLINDAASATAFANAIESTLRPFGGSTSISEALNFAAPKFATNLFDGTRNVIDISGDGENNSGGSLATARTNALTQVNTINGLPIGGGSLNDYYATQVIGGTNAFSIPSNTFADFEAAVAKKLEKEIISTPVPEPTTILGTLLFSSLGGGALLKRKHKKTV